jgi:hypothetical protein
VCATGGKGVPARLIGAWPSAAKNEEGIKAKQVKRAFFKIEFMCGFPIL